MSEAEVNSRPLSVKDHEYRFIIAKDINERYDRVVSRSVRVEDGHSVELDEEGMLFNGLPGKDGTTVLAVTKGETSSFRSTPNIILAPIGFYYGGTLIAFPDETVERYKQYPVGTYRSPHTVKIGELGVTYVKKDKSEVVKAKVPKEKDPNLLKIPSVLMSNESGLDVSVGLNNIGLIKVEGAADGKIRLRLSEEGGYSENYYINSGDLFESGEVVSKEREYLNKVLLQTKEYLLDPSRSKKFPESAYHAVSLIGALEALKTPTINEIRVVKKTTIFAIKRVMEKENRVPNQVGESERHTITDSFIYALNSYPHGNQPVHNVMSRGVTMLSILHLNDSTEARWTGRILRFMSHLLNKFFDDAEKKASE